MKENKFHSVCFVCAFWVGEWMCVCWSCSRKIYDVKDLQQLLSIAIEPNINKRKKWRLESWDMIRYDMIGCDLITLPNDHIWSDAHRSTCIFRMKRFFHFISFVAIFSQSMTQQYGWILSGLKITLHKYKMRILLVFVWFRTIVGLQSWV